MFNNQKNNQKKIIKTDMSIQIIGVWKGIAIAFSNLCTSAWGKILVAGGFIGATFASISGLIHVMLVLCLIDLILGVSVTVYKKGLEHIISSRLRDTLIKISFYLILIMGLFLVETQLVNGYYLTSKAVFALISGVELLSIIASMLILFPNFPVLKLLKRILTKEMAKKLGLTEEEIDNDTKTNI